jgi:queuine tRNA-ribosyltransferase
MGKISDKEVLFKSPVDGSSYRLSPEEAIKIQFDLGVDMMVCLDDCPPNNASKDDLSRAVTRTILWAKRCRKEYDRQIKKRRIVKNNRPLLFSVIQGGNDMFLRKFCAESLVKIGFDGYGFGAMPIGEDGKFADEILEKTANLIPENSLRFALGIGRPEDMVKCAHYGWDMFDCVIPTREGRHGKMFVWEKKNKKFFYKSINISNSKFSIDLTSINNKSSIADLREYSLAYLHHLFKSKDMLGQKLASLNNLEFYANLMKKIRKGDFINSL